MFAHLHLVAARRTSFKEARLRPAAAAVSGERITQDGKEREREREREREK